MALLRGTTALSLVSLLQLDMIKLMFSSSLFVSVSISLSLSKVYGACYCLFLTSSPHTSPFPLPDPIPQLATHPPATYNEFSYDKLFAVLYSHLLCLSTSCTEQDLWLFFTQQFTSSSLLPTRGALIPGWHSHAGHQETSGRLDRATNILNGKKQVLL